MFEYNAFYQILNKIQYYYQFFDNSCLQVFNLPYLKNEIVLNGDGEIVILSKNFVGDEVLRYLELRRQYLS